MSASRGGNLLSERDPAPVELVNGGGASRVVLSCEHAGRAIPEQLGNLGVSAPDLDRHIAWDPGARGVAAHLSRLIDAPLVAQRYSRLVIDCNRPFAAGDCVPATSDGTIVPANQNLDEAARRLRYDTVHQPFHAELAAFLDRRGRDAVLVAVHSFTPQLRGGQPRPWHLGALFNRDRALTDRFLAAFAENYPDVPAAANQPYVVEDASDYTIPVHAEARGLPYLLLEIRNDLIAEPGDQEEWAERIAHALGAALALQR